MKLKQIIRMGCCALLLLVLLAATGCALLQGKRNAVAAVSYCVDPIEDAIVRYELSADGKLLRVTYLEWDTLQPKRYMSTNRDWSYEYGLGGALRAATASGAALTLSEQEDGTLYGRGYDSLGGAHSVHYTLDENGRITSELYTKGQKPYGTRDQIHDYDELGRICSITRRVKETWSDEVTESVYTYDYTAQALEIACNGEPYATLALNQSGLPVSYTKAGASEPAYTWQYDEGGRPAPVREDVRWDYDENDRLITVYSKDESGEWAVTHEYRYDKKGALTCAVKTAVHDSTTTISTREFSGGVCVRSVTEYWGSGEQSNRITRVSETQYHPNGAYDKGAMYTVAEDGEKSLSQEMGYEWDAYGRSLGYYTRLYRYGEQEAWSEESVAYEYRENGEICAVTNGEIHREPGYSYDQKTTDYYNEEFVKVSGRDVLIWLEPDENGDMLHRVSEYEYGANENITHAVSYGYRNDELVSEVVQDHDDNYGDGYYATYHAKEYEDGVMTREYKRVEDEEGGSVCSEQIYVGGVLREETDEIKERGWYITEDGTMFTRPVSGTYKTYDESGALLGIEERTYTFYEDGMRKSTDFTLKNPDGSVIKQYSEQYDENGTLVENTEPK